MWRYARPGLGAGTFIRHQDRYRGYVRSSYILVRLIKKRREKKKIIRAHPGFTLAPCLFLESCKIPKIRAVSHRLDTPLFHISISDPRQISDVHCDSSFILHDSEPGATGEKERQGERKALTIINRTLDQSPFFCLSQAWLGPNVLSFFSR